VIAGKYIVKHPLFGGCEDCMVSVYQEAEYKILTRPANEYLQYGAFFGIPALLCYVMTLIMIAVQKIKNVKRLSPAILILGGAVLSYAISACFGNTTVYTTFDFFVLLGLVTCDKTQE
jgi:O-antigen ligase